MSNTQIHVHVWKLGVRRDDAYWLFALLFREHLDHFPLCSARNNQEGVSSWENIVALRSWCIERHFCLVAITSWQKNFPHAFHIQGLEFPVHGFLIWLHLCTLQAPGIIPQTGDRPLRCPAGSSTYCCKWPWLFLEVFPVWNENHEHFWVQRNYSPPMASIS